MADPRSRDDSDPTTKSGVRRLQLGSGRLEALSPAALAVFADPSWLHLGDAPPTEDAPRPPLSALLSVMATQGPRAFLEKLRTRLRPPPPAMDPAEIEARTTFLAHVYRVGDRLPLEDGSIDYVFSEHFFEHLFLDEAVALLGECRRVLRPGGVVRTVVPDADLRTYEPPEPVGFPYRAVGFDHPSKHKTRWSVYSLSQALASAGLRAVPVIYCDRHGRFVRNHPEDLRDRYGACADEAMVFSLDHVMRPHSLVVDGVKDG